MFISDNAYVFLLLTVLFSLVSSTDKVIKWILYPDVFSIFNISLWVFLWVSFLCWNSSSLQACCWSLPLNPLYIDRSIEVLFDTSIICINSGFVSINCIISLWWILFSCLYCPTIFYHMPKIVHNRIKTEINNVFAPRQRPISLTSGLLMSKTESIYYSWSESGLCYFGYLQYITEDKLSQC